MAIAAGVFFVSLAGLVSLFVLKSAETKRGTPFAASVRARADTRALALKALMLRVRRELDKVPPAAVYFTRFALHELALAAARLARLSEKQFHNIADFVSHKRGFEKREPRSEFLKQVGEVKNGAGQDEKNDV